MIVTRSRWSRHHGDEKILLDQESSICLENDAFGADTSVIADGLRPRVWAGSIFVLLERQLSQICLSQFVQGFLELGKGEAFDTFPNMFPDEQYLRDSEIKHGRQAMLAWTGVWATSTVSAFLGRE